MGDNYQTWSLNRRNELTANILYLEDKISISFKGGPGEYW